LAPLTCKLVVMPGLDGTGLLLDAFAKEMSRYCAADVLRYPSDVVSYDDLVPWVAERLPEAPFMLLAESFSGPLAIKVASAAPDGLRGVIFITSFARAPMGVPAVLAEGLRGVPVTSPLALKIIAPFCVGLEPQPEIMELFAKALEQVPVDTLADRLREILDTDETEALAALPVPHGVIAGAHDRLVPPRRAEELKRGAAFFKTIDGPHFMMQRHPRAAAKAVKEAMICLGATDV